MDWNKVCPACMRELSEAEAAEKSCPYCGFMISEEDRTNALPVNTILNGKYILGKLLSHTEEEITYLAYDLNLEIKIQISEYFPKTLARRAENGRMAEPQPGQENAFSRGLEAYREEAKTLVKADSITGDERSIREVFTENGTAYRVLFALPEESGVTVGTEEIADVKQAVSKWKNKWILFGAVIAAAVFLTAGIIMAVNQADRQDTVSNDGKGKKTRGNTITVAEETMESRSSLLGAYYEPENVVLLLAQSTIYFGHPDKDGMVQDIVALTSLEDESDTFLSVAVDDGYVYMAYACEEGISYGIFRTPIEASEVKFTPVTERNVWSDFVFYDKYIFYAAENVLYRAAKDGSNEIVLNSHASDKFVVYENRIYFYSEEDGYVHRMNPDGSDEQIWADADDVNCMAACKGYLFVNTGGKIYQLDIKTGLPEDENGLDECIEYSDILIYGNRICYANSDGKTLYGYDISKGDKTAVYEGETYAMAVILNDRLYIADWNGDYFSTNPDSMDLKKLDFNYFTAAEVYGK